MSKFYRQPQVTSHADSTRAALLARVPWRVLLIIAVACMSVVYLWLVNGSAASGFAVTRLETQRKQLDLEYAKYERELAEAQSLQRLAESSTQLGLVPVNHIEYVSSSSTTALR